ncbi:MAG: hypothetical protein HFE39_00995 [Clostridiales bacterium]|nr:hypothetical protein [Clostridiales bacterium]
MERKPLAITFHDPNPPGRMGNYMIQVLGCGISEQIKTSVAAEQTRLKQEQNQLQSNYIPQSLNP